MNCTRFIMIAISACTYHIGRDCPTVQPVQMDSVKYSCACPLKYDVNTLGILSIEIASGSHIENLHR